MELYTSTPISNLATPWGTQPETTVPGMSALDVLRLVDLAQLGQGTRAVVRNTHESHIETPLSRVFRSLKQQPENSS